MEKTLIPCPGHPVDSNSFSVWGVGVLHNAEGPCYNL